MRGDHDPFGIFPNGYHLFFFLFFLFWPEQERIKKPNKKDSVRPAKHTYKQGEGERERERERSPP
jgi:hypothetical protein